MKERVMVSMDPGLRERAHAHGLNVSAVAAAALLRSVQALEQETGDGRQTHAPAIASSGGT